MVSNKGQIIKNMLFEIQNNNPDMQEIPTPYKNLLHAEELEALLKKSSYPVPKPK